MKPVRISLEKSLKLAIIHSIMLSFSYFSIAGFSSMFGTECFFFI